MSTKYELTKFEYDLLNQEFIRLKEKESKLRTSHIDAVSEGDDRECDAWSLTNDLSNQNYKSLSELSEVLSNSKIIKPRQIDIKVTFGSKVTCLLNKIEKRFIFCHEICTPYIENGISNLSPVGKAIQNMKKRSEIFIKELNNLNIVILDIEN